MFLMLFCIFLSFIMYFGIPLYWYLSREAFWQETVLSPLTHDLCQPPPGTQLPSDTSSFYQLPVCIFIFLHLGKYFTIFLRYWTSILLIQFLFGLLPRNKSSVSLRLRQMCRPVYLLLFKIPSCASSRDLKKFVLLRGNSWSSRHFN